MKLIKLFKVKRISLCFFLTDYHGIEKWYTQRNPVIPEGVNESEEINLALTRLGYDTAVGETEDHLQPQEVSISMNWFCPSLAVHFILGKGQHECSEYCKDEVTCAVKISTVAPQYAHASLGKYF